MKTEPQRCNGMSLVEVTMAIGIIAFVAVALMGLLPVMLNTVRESREATVVARIHQAVAADLRENFDTPAGPWYFNREGLRMTNSSEASYQAIAGSPDPVRFGDSTNFHVLMIPLAIENPDRHQTNLIRPIFINHETLPPSSP